MHRLTTHNAFWIKLLSVFLAGTAGWVSGCKSNDQIAHGLDDPKLTPLMNAAGKNDLKRVQKLLASGANVNERTNNGYTALYKAIERFSPTEDNVPVVKTLLDAGADPNQPVFSTNSPPLNISITRDYGNPTVTLMLLKAGAKVSRTCEEGDSLLSLATQESSVEVVSALLAAGAPPNCTDNGTPLYWASINGWTDKVAVLLKGGADPNMRGDPGKSAIKASPRSVSTP